jgi:hypothetical protein
MTLALVRRQTATAEIKRGKTVDKWKVFRDASAAMELLGIQSNSLAVLDALLSFYPDNELSQDAQLIVFPSNAQLMLRAHAMSGATLRRHLALLVEAGLIVRKDSANGKRYARRDGDGQIENAFGFDLSPLLARSEELAALAQQVFADRENLRRAKENLTICRREVRWKHATAERGDESFSAKCRDESLPDDIGLWAWRRNPKLAGPNVGRGGCSLYAGRKPFGVSRRLRGHGARKCSCGCRLHAGAR